MSIFQPSNQIRLTNVSIVRLRKGGKRFEIACYKNKVIEWRNGIEQDLENVLQVRSVFMNVSKGQLANNEDLEKAFKTTDQDAIVLEILKKGELQVSTLERNNQLENTMKDVINIIVEKTVNPDTKRPYTSTLIEKALQDLHYSFNPNKNSKQQALDIIRLLQEKRIVPIARAQMRVQLVLPAAAAKRMKEKLMANVSKVETEDWGSSEYTLEALIDPGQFRAISSLLQEETKGKGRLDVLSLKETADGDERF